MTDYGHDLLFGSFVTPGAQDPRKAVDLAITADKAGLDLVTFQDHPYQPGFLDTWTLLSYAAARTQRIRLSGNVLSLPLRPPAVLARAAASLDVLSGGRIELGLGAGAFWDGIAAMGGRRLSPGQGVDALAEGIGIIRDLWDVDARGRVDHDGEYYTVKGAKRGPRPAHDIGIWIGAYKKRMLALTGALGDGWLPSMDYLPKGPDSLPEMNARIDEAATEAGRQPSDVRRLMNFMRAGEDSDQWAEYLAGLALDHGISAFIVGGDDHATTERLAAEVAPAVRELVARERGRTAPAT
ncbi:alkanesulfonate monooxygenase SsuD/methylene tetrahydromethanopterin reductase-like flavin-dependent oxidoreductase (luciferase family) [Actinoplanes lutulentus]|uniref:Alkanesulfonate monooxygenase SsuD/methylene tetrahydromethanopterin reductase-like flavin-dependent oxidoreductase (Luciferase family) n=1 Tax=Actinoplanes lutulentus TaxID=1287878 RepID=A0A327Z4M2_9ACTN|nr:LLM class flavin-dependent oxidoreductase [Actinoplanes lutulentus]MBB2948834.1 alkanesulfonate monooxygenase SsuD/methylene tetrahydromethanopterin reductase-like flavin-dependent oxidoreductase (luciferase family) [Actinoplanes lutulentus]RAK29745.1 alkanesulfonate monooxygenase SsuD/methylene tetrahydromethanopterin reductase-like flavin-dependent oxidoreductase (luciferase family) [Actinoplanes lutulentus]